MKKFAALIICFIACFNLYGQYKDTAYIYTYGGIQEDVCSQIKPTNDGGYIMIGTSNSFGCGNTDFYAVKIDSVGRHEWSKTYGGIENEEGFSVTQTFDKGYAFLGFTDSYGAGGYDVFLVKTDSMGNFQWQRTYGGSDWDFGYSIQQLSDSGFVMCGLTYSYGSGNGNVYVIRTDKSGDALWTRTIVDTNYYKYYSVANSICVEKDSLYAIVGNISPSEGDTNVYFILMNDKGRLEKEARYGGIHINEGNSINVTLDHGFIVFGATDSLIQGKPDEMLLKLDSAGKMQWMQIYGSAVGNNIGEDAIQALDGSFLAVSASRAGYGLGPESMRIWHIDSYGNPLSGPSFGGTGLQWGNSIALAKDGNAVFIGATNSPGYTEGLNDVYLVRLKNDSVVQNYTLSIHQYKDTCMCTIGIPVQTNILPKVKVFPNPVSYSATILIQGVTGQQYSFRLYNESGSCVIQKVPLEQIAHGQAIAHFEKANLAAGIYLYEILDQSGANVATGKIIAE